MGPKIVDQTWLSWSLGVRCEGLDSEGLDSEVIFWVCSQLSTYHKLIHYSKVILYQDHKREALFMYLFDNQLVLCSNGQTDHDLVYYKRFDLAFLTFKIEDNNFIFTRSGETPPNVQNFKPPICTKSESFSTKLKSSFRFTREHKDYGHIPRLGNIDSTETDGGEDRVEIHVKGRRARQQWRYLLSLEIGFAKIKYNHSNSEENTQNGLNGKSDIRIAEDICNFIRNLNKETT